MTPETPAFEDAVFVVSGRMYRAQIEVSSVTPSARVLIGGVWVHDTNTSIADLTDLSQTPVRVLCKLRTNGSCELVAETVDAIERSKGT